MGIVHAKVLDYLPNTKPDFSRKNRDAALNLLCRILPTNWHKSQILATRKKGLPFAQR